VVLCVLSTLISSLDLSYINECCVTLMNSVFMQAQKIVENAKNVFEKLEQVRPTKSGLYGCFAGRLLAKSAYIDAELAWTLSEGHDERVLAACQVFMHLTSAW